MTRTPFHALAAVALTAALTPATMASAHATSPAQTIDKSPAVASGKGAAAKKGPTTLKSRPILYGKPGGRMYHVPAGVPYRFGNSPAGIKRAAVRGFAQVDIDLQMTKDGVIVGTHWHAPMRFDGFYDPAGKLSRNRTVASMTWAQVSRLRSHDGHRIRKLAALMPHLAKWKLIGSLEVKQDIRFAKPRVMRTIKAMADEHRVNAYIKQIPSLSRKHKQTLAAARKAGFWTRNAGVANVNWRGPVRGN